MMSYERKSNARGIPENELVDEEEETTVYGVQDDEVGRSNVEVGREEDGRVEMLSGLIDDDQVVVIGHSGLRDGSKVLASVTDLGRITG